MRTFLALSLSVGAVRRVAEAVEKKLAELGEEGRRLAWVPPAQYHVTLKFLGDIPPEPIAAIGAALRRRLGDLPPIPLKLAGLRSFPAQAEDGPPRVLWVGVDGGQALLSVHAAIEGDLHALGFPREARPFQPHLTVARAPAGSGALAAAWRAELDLGEDLGREVVVYESRREQQSHRGGVEYHAHARVPFAKTTR